MSSPCTVPRLVRCRVRDLASCFYACRLPLEEEPDSFCCKPPQMSKESRFFESKGAGRGHKASGKISIAKKMCKEDGGESVQSSSQKSSSKGGRTAEDGIRAEPRFAEEDYIVFCFRDDGAIHMINEGNSSDSYDENDEDATITTTTTSTLRPISSRKGDEKGSKETDTEWPPDDEIREINPVEQPNASKMDSFESCDSNLSDTSTSSFAFPVLGIEWIGSPVHMPKSEKHESQSVRLHCCRF
ncbi:hypothetical protein Pfo_020497 [Paulownia fortunei]|nr:hypothetical protein Pfo_020497 [Paulownia fortunei]